MMKDNDIIKSFGSLYKKLLDVKYDLKITAKEFQALNSVNALINRQQAENERLKTAYETLKQEYDSMFSANRNLMAEVEELTSDCEKYKVERDEFANHIVRIREIAQAEAIKEFAERVYKTLTTKENWRAFKRAWLDNGECDWLKRKLFNLAKEMTERKDEGK